MDFSEITTPLTLKQVDSLYWLGRYAERVLSTLRVFMRVYDSQLDNNFDFSEYCQNLDIYNGFTDLKDFCNRYAFDKSYASSISCSMMRAYDNAIMLRDIIGSEALSYIEMAQRTLLDSEFSRTPMLMFQKVIDYIMGFYGVISDTIIDRNIRNIILCGHGVERLDFYLRLGINENKIQFECRRLAQAFSYTDISVDKFTISKICGELCEADNVQDYADKMLLLQLIDGYFVSQ